MPLTPNVAWSEAIARSQEATSWQPGGGSDAVDLGDDRLRMADDRLHQTRADREGFFEEGPAPVRIGAVRSHLLEVVAGAEHLSGGRDDDDADRVIVARAVEFGLDVAHHLDRQQVGRRIGKRDAQYAVVERCRRIFGGSRLSETISAISVSNPLRTERLCIRCGKLAHKLASGRLKNSFCLCFLIMPGKQRRARDGRPEEERCPSRPISNRC